MGSGQSALPSPSHFMFLRFRFREISTIGEDLVARETILRRLRNTWPADPAVFMESLAYDFVRSFTLSPECSFSLRFLAILIQDLRRQGWKLVFNCNPSQYLFGKVEEKEEVSDTANLNICLDTVQLCRSPPFLRQILQNSLGQHFAAEWQIEDGYEVGLANPELWKSGSSHIGRLIILAVVRNFTKCGFYLDSASTLEDVSSLYFTTRVPLPLPANAQKHYFLFSIKSHSYIELLGATPHVQQLVRTAIKQNWKHGLRGSKNITPGQIEFELHNMPWSAARSKDAARAMQFLVNLFQNLATEGWRIASAVDLECCQGSKKSLFFGSCAPGFIPHFCLGPTGEYKMGIVNGCSNIINACLETVARQWTPGFKSHGTWKGKMESAYQIVLNGQPWHDKITSFTSQKTIGMFLHQFHLLGWKPVAAINIAGDVDFWFDPFKMQVERPDCWFFARNEFAHQENDAPGPSSRSDAPPNYEDVTNNGQRSIGMAATEQEDSPPSYETVMLFRTK